MPPPGETLATEPVPGDTRRPALLATLIRDAGGRCVPVHVRLCCGPRDRRLDHLPAGRRAPGSLPAGVFRSGKVVGGHRDRARPRGAHVGLPPEAAPPINRPPESLDAGLPPLQHRGQLTSEHILVAEAADAARHRPSGPLPPRRRNPVHEQSPFTLRKMSIAPLGLVRQNTSCRASHPGVRGDRSPVRFGGAPGSVELLQCHGTAVEVFSGVVESRSSMS